MPMRQDVRSWPPGPNESMITITVNGRSRSVPEAVTLAGLLAHLTIDPRMVVVEHNRTIVRRVGLDDVRVQPGDEVEIVQFVGGG